MYLPNARTRRAATAVFLAPSLIGVVVFCLVPIGMSLFYSFHDYDLLALSMDFLGLKNFTRILGGREFPQVLAHTLTYLGLYLPLILLTSLGQALILNQSFPGRYGLMNQALAALGITGPAWLSSRAWAMPGIVLTAIWKDTGYYALMVLAALKSIDPSLYEAAAIDGAGGARRFLRITLPLLSPTLFLLVVINVIYGLQVFESVLIMTDGGPGGATTVFLERIYKYAFRQYKMGMASAYSWILFVIILVLTLVQFRAQKKWVNYDA